jgi:hypothetical protein
MSPHVVTQFDRETAMNLNAADGQAVPLIRFEHGNAFWDGAAARVLDMLLARDASRSVSTLS